MAKKTLKYVSGFIFITFLMAMLLTVLLSFFAYYRYPQLLPSHLTFTYWSDMILENALFKQAIGMSIIVGCLSALLSTLIGFMAGHGIVKMRWQKNSMVILAYSLPLLIPITSLFIGAHMILITLKLNNTMIGVILAHGLIAIPYATNIAISFFSGISPDMLAVARTLGASKVNRFYRVILPLLLPGIAFSLGMSFLLSMSDYFATFLIGGGKVITLSSIYYPLIGNADYGHSSVLSLIFLLVNMTVFFIVDRVTRKHMKVGDYLYE